MVVPSSYMQLQRKSGRHPFCLVSKEHTGGIRATEGPVTGQRQCPPPTPPQVQPGLKQGTPSPISLMS